MEEDKFGKIVPMKQDGWEYVKPFNTIHFNLLIVYLSGKYNGRAFESRNIRGYHLLKDQNDKGLYRKSEIGSLEAEYSEVSELEKVLGRYMSERECNVIHSNCDKTAEEITREHFNNKGLIDRGLMNWALDREYRRKHEILEENPPIGKVYIRM